MSSSPAVVHRSSSRVRGLQVNCFAAVVMLLAELGLGTWVNLYGQLPPSDHGANIASGFMRAIYDGPVGLSIHALLGAGLLISATVAVARSALLRQRALQVATALGLFAIGVAAISGAVFIGNDANGASMAMALGDAVAIGAYAFVLFITGLRARQ